MTSHDATVPRKTSPERCQDGSGRESRREPLTTHQTESAVPRESAAHR